MSLKVETEIQLESDACAASWDNKLFVGTEDGSIKSFDTSLSPGAAWAAHGVQLFALEAKEGRVYSTSNDGGVRVWTHDGTKITELPSCGSDIGALFICNKTEVFAGDEAGNVTVYEDDKEKARYNLLEEVKSIAFLRPFLFSVRDLDVIITEIKPDDSKTRYFTRHTMPGRAPLRLCGNKLLAMARGGNDMQLFDINPDTTFKKLHEIKVSDMIVNSITTSGDYVWTGGWDGQVRRWKIADDKLEPAGDISLGGKSAGGVTVVIHCSPWPCRQEAHEGTPLGFSGCESHITLSSPPGGGGMHKAFPSVNKKKKKKGDISLGSSINALAASDHNNVYAALAGGRIVKIKNY